MYTYSDEERRIVQNRIKDERYQSKTVDMSMAYQLYDIMRITLEGVSEINERLNAIEKK
jgi:hypothetical protein